LGAKKVEAYGEDVLGVVAESCAGLVGS